MGGALRRVAEIGKEYDLEIGNVFHAGDGNLHPLVFFDSSDQEQLKRVHRAGKRILEVCTEAGGTITGEHGIGVEKIQAMPLFFGPNEIELMQTIKGWTVLGHGESQLSLTRRILKKSLDFTKKSRETDVGISVIEEAISNFSMKCNPPDAATALYLLSAPAREMSVNLLDEISDYMKSLASNAIIRSGDYPSRWGLISIDIILSQLETVEKIQKIYEETVEGTEKM